ncbi:MAG: bifunctional DNA primase/polymerase [Nakamurella sp.]
MIDAALQAAAAGWRVHPCRSAGPAAKAPHLPHGHHEATTDPDQVRDWWTRWPDALIGAVVPDTLLVLDIDPRNGGALADLQEIAGGALPETLTVWSGRGDGGLHLYFRRPPGVFTSTRLPVGIDLKVHGYCILPPSLHPEIGEPYTWQEHPPARLPRRLREAITPQPVPAAQGYALSAYPSDRSVAGLVRFIEQQTEGNRNSGLYWAACRAAEAGQISAVADTLVAAAVAAGETDRAARRTVQSAARRYGVPA